MVHRIGIAALVSGAIAQALKVAVDLLREPGAFNLLRFFDNGGMPSSHTSLWSPHSPSASGVTPAWILRSSASPLSSACISCSRAAGLRQEVGNQARVLNELVDELRQTHHVDRARLKELVGHTWGEVFGGFLVGLAVAWIAFP